MATSRPRRYVRSAASSDTLPTPISRFCAGAKSEESPAKPDYEKIVGKAELVAGLKAAMAYCETAFAMPHGKEHEPTSVFGMKGSRLWVLTFNISHNAEHYGNIVTYMRMKGMTPPSSQGG